MKKLISILFLGIILLTGVSLNNSEHSNKKNKIIYKKYSYNITLKAKIKQPADSLLLQMKKLESNINLAEKKLQNINKKEDFIKNDSIFVQN